MKYYFLLLLCTAFTTNAQHHADNLENLVFRISEVDSKPEFPQGLYTLSIFVSEHLKMPDVTNKKLHLITSFVVEPDGKLSDIRFVHMKVEDLLPAEDIEKNAAQDFPELDFIKNDIVRVLALNDTPWIPAIKNGAAVRCRYHYPININIE